MSNDPKGFDPQYDDNKVENHIYFHKVNQEKDRRPYRKVELLFSGNSLLTTKNQENKSDTPIEFEIREKLELHETNGGQQKVACWLVETPFNNHLPLLQALHISRRTAKGTYGSQEITLYTDGIIKLKTFLDSLQFADFNKTSTYKQPLGKINPKKIITPDEFTQIVLDNITSIDDFEKIVAIKQREKAIARLKEIIAGQYTNEIDIQNFLKENLWLFGNEYALFVKDNKINEKNILDLIPENLDSYIDIIEVKLPSETPFNFDQSHKNYYCTAPLTQAIAQTQNYIFELEQNVKENYTTTNSCKIIRPKGIVLFGSNNPLTDGEKNYLRILNSSYHNLTIVTYQQLLSRAENSLVIKNKSK